MMVNNCRWDWLTLSGVGSVATLSLFESVDCVETFDCSNSAIRRCNSAMTFAASCPNASCWAERVTSSTRLFRSGCDARNAG